jgi:hypothetical protein
MHYGEIRYDAASANENSDRKMLDISGRKLFRGQADVSPEMYTYRVPSKRVFVATKPGKKSTAASF